MRLAEILARLRQENATADQLDPHSTLEWLPTTAQLETALTRRNLP